MQASLKGRRSLLRKICPYTERLSLDKRLIKGIWWSRAGLIEGLSHQSIQSLRIKYCIHGWLKLVRSRTRDHQTPFIKIARAAPEIALSTISN